MPSWTPNGLPLLVAVLLLLAPPSAHAVILCDGTCTTPPEDEIEYDFALALAGEEGECIKVNATGYAYVVGPLQIDHMSLNAESTVAAGSTLHAFGIPDTGISPESQIDEKR